MKNCVKYTQNSVQNEKKTAKAVRTVSTGKKSNKPILKLSQTLTTPSESLHEYYNLFLLN